MSKRIQKVIKTVFVCIEKFVNIPADFLVKIYFISCGIFTFYVIQFFICNCLLIVVITSFSKIMTKTIKNLDLRNLRNLRNTF